MRTDNFEFLSNLDTLAAVVLGALLATAGGLVAEHYEDQIERKRRERDAARFFGEILASIDEILDFAFQSQGVGDPWGSVTVRMFKTAHREAEVYERNRERLFDVLDPPLRARIHRHFLLEAFPLEAIVELSEEIQGLENTLKEDPDMAPGRVERIKARIDEARGGRERTLDVLKIEREKTGDICADLIKRAGVKTGKTGVEGKWNWIRQAPGN
ncbi:MAG: hypothetical protein ABL957_07470 [Parvularculaceae bacterium]